jgi:hypothetical protein
MKPARRITATLAGLAPALAFAHEGHGADTLSHWHASDALGLALAVAAGGVLLWLRRK